MKTTRIQRRILQLAADGRKDEAIALIKHELKSTTTVQSPDGAIVDPDHMRRIMAVQVALKIL